jgi:hypothetical protein
MACLPKPMTCLIHIVIWSFALLSAVKPPGADVGMLHRPGRVSSQPSVSWLRDFFDFDLWPPWFSRLMSCWCDLRYGAFFCALFVNTCPVAEMSCPAPAVV